MTQFINNAYESIRKCVSDNHGWNSDLYSSPAGISYTKAMEEIKALENKKVEIHFTAEMDFASTHGKKIGKIKVVDNRIRFYEGRKTTRFYYLDAGVFEGFFATLVPMRITSI